MLLFDGVLGVVALGIWIFCIIDVITTPEANCRNLPKMAWLLIVILLADIGSIAWLVAGHSWEPRSADLAARGNRVGAPRAGRVPRRASNPDDDEDFLAGLQARADEQRRRAREAQQREEPPGGTGPSA